MPTNKLQILLKKINKNYFNEVGRVDSGGLKIESLKGLQELKDQTCKVTVTDRKEIKEKVLPLLYNQLYTGKKVKAFEKHWLKKEDIAKEMIGKTIRGEGLPSKDWLRDLQMEKGHSILQ